MMKAYLAAMATIALGAALLISPSLASPSKIAAPMLPVTQEQGQPTMTLIRQEERNGACLYTTVANIKYCRDGTNFLCDRWLFGTITGHFYEGDTCADLRAQGIDTGRGD